MAYQYFEFDGVALPLLIHNQEHNPMGAESTLIDSIGGVVDWRGTTRSKGRKQQIALSGVYLGETEVLVDHADEVLVDETGEELIAGDSVHMLYSAVIEPMRKVGVSGALWRRRMADEVLEWKTARLLEMPWPRMWQDHALRAQITCLFESSMEYWHAASVTTSSGSITAGVVGAIVVENVGLQVDDAVVTVTRTSGTITTFTLTCAALGIGWQWTGSIASGEVLTIDTGAQTVLKGTAGAYSGFVLSEHTAAGWLPLPTGAHVFNLTVLGGNATVAFAHYTQFP